MTNSLSISRVVNVSVQLTPAGAQAQSLSNLLVLGTSTVIDTVERVRSYTGLAGVAVDFGTTCEEYYAAVRWFGQTPQPTNLMIGRWLKSAAAGGLMGGSLPTAERVMSTWTSVVNGGFDVLVDGTLQQITGLNFSAAANLNAVAAIIDTAVTGATVVWNDAYGRFEAVSSTTGTASAISFLAVATASGSPVDISGKLHGRSTNTGAYLYAGALAETALQSVTLMENNLGQRWYGLVIPGATDSDSTAVAAYIEAATGKHVFGVNTSDAGVLVSSNTTNIAYLLKASGYKRTLVQYSSSDAYAVLSALARILTTNFRGSATVITLKFKQEPGITPENLNASQIANANAVHANVFVMYNNDTAIIEQGVMADGTFVDIVTGTDWLALTIQTNIYNLLYTNPTKVPQTNQGMQLLTAAVEAVCSQGVINGLLAPGVWNSNGFGQLAQGDYMQKGYYVWTASVDSQAQNDRTARLAMPIQVAAKLAGAIHFADVAIIVNQ